jgi:hypothetical protein
MGKSAAAFLHIRYPNSRLSRTVTVTPMASPLDLFPIASIVELHWPPLI